MLAAALTLLACAPAAFAAPQTLVGGAYGLMKSYMQQDAKDGFAKVVDLGGSSTYRVMLNSLTVKVDPALKPVAQYDPKTKTLTFSKDPRKVKGAGKAAMGETVWHEVTHAIEDKHGDIGVFDSEAYAERNVDYMTYVVRSSLPWLEQMEKQAKAGASVTKLGQYWQKYLASMAAAAKLPSTTAYPPDLGLMRTWFGFRANPDEIKTLYLTDKAFSDKKWANLRKALGGHVLAIGDSYQGGVIAYFLKSGDPGYDPKVKHGLIAAAADQSRSAPWSNIVSFASGATGTAIGTGQANTKTIVDQTATTDGVPVTCTGGAAYVCSQLDQGGYSDWYLPSRDELTKLYLNKDAIGRFDSHTIYWSSSEFIPLSNGGLPMPPGAWNQEFDNGHWFSTDKNMSYAHGVRAVRAF